jgi:MFS superfamily sulfate permease-like transporter
MKNIFSYVDWPEGYGRTSLKMDIMAGLTVALVLIPQSMAYAELAGLPPYFGLYASAPVINWLPGRWRWFRF